MKAIETEKLLVQKLLSSSIANKKIEFNKITSLERLGGDASTRRYYRAYDGQITCVICLDSPFEKENDFITSQKILSNNNISVPKIYDFNSQFGYILEEDLGDTTLLLELSRTLSVSHELSLYQKVLDDLARLHKIKTSDYTGHVFTSRSFDYDKFMSEFNFTYNNFFLKFLKSNFSQDEKKLLFAFFEEVSLKLSTGTKVTTHRDFHSRNIMIKNEKHYIIDFQDMMLGIPQYDLVSILEDCYYQLSTENKDKLIRYYWSLLSNETTFLNENFESFVFKYNMMAIQRTLKAIGSFSYIYFLRSDIRYLKYIGYGFEKLRCLLIKFNEFDQVRKVISRRYYES